MDVAERLDAIEQIKQLKARYFRHVDLKQWELFRGLFAPDFVSLDAQGAVAVRGGETFAREVEAFLDPALTIHHAYTPEIEIVDADNARGIWVMHDSLTWPDGDPRGGMKSMTGWGHYTETYRRIDAAWRIASLQLTRLKVDVAR